MRIWIIGLSLIMLIAGCTGTQNEETAATGMPDEDTAAVRQDVLYYCNCGPECTCNTLSTVAADCTCGEPLKWGHVVRVENTEALICQCEDGCECEGLTEEDPTVCSCGAPIKRVNMAGTGLYYCNCGGSCTCNFISDKPGKCKCGMDLVTS